MTTQNTISNTNPFITWLETGADGHQEELETLCRIYELPKAVMDALKALTWLKPSSLTLLSIARKLNMDSETLIKVIELTEPDPLQKITHEFVELSRIYLMLSDELRNDLMDAARIKAELHFRLLAADRENCPKRSEPDEKELTLIENFYFSLPAEAQQTFLDVMRVMNQPFPRLANDKALPKVDENNFIPFADPYYF